MQIIPQNNYIQLEVEKPIAGNLVTDSADVAVEIGTIIAIGEEVKGNYKINDRIFFKAWGTDIVNHEDKRYIFIAEDTNAILAKIK